MDIATNTRDVCFTPKSGHSSGVTFLWFARETGLVPEFSKIKIGNIAVAGRVHDKEDIAMKKFLLIAAASFNPCRNGSCQRAGLFRRGASVLAWVTQTMVGATVIGGTAALTSEMTAA